MKKIKSCFSIALLGLSFLFVRPLPAQQYVDVPLYDAEDAATGGDVPFMRVFPAERPNGCAVLACPGGGYRYLEFEKEGCAFAPWFNNRGITLAVLHYRLPAGNPELPLADASQAMKCLRSNAGQWKLDTDKIGIMGSSAGGHLASTLATHFDNSTRPDFQVLLYPVITMDGAFTHEGSRTELLGKKPSAKQVRAFSSERQVKPQTPPAFIALSDNDNIVPPANSMEYYRALNAHKVSVEMHVYPTGGHGWGMHAGDKYYPQWTAALDEWLKAVVLTHDAR